MIDKRHTRARTGGEDEQTDKLVELLQANTELTQQDKELTEQVAKLTKRDPRAAGRSSAS